MTRKYRSKGPQPLWPSCHDEHGMPVRLAVFQLVSHLGIIDGQHSYETKCILCGHVSVKKQKTLQRAARIGQKTCNHCPRKGPKKKIFAIPPGAAVKYVKSFDGGEDWLKVIKCWPIVSLQDREGFDTERLSAANMQPQPAVGKNTGSR